MVGKGLRAEQTLLLAYMPDEQDRSFWLRTLDERTRDRKQGHTARSVVIGPVRNRISRGARLNADVIVMRAVRHEGVAQGGIGAAHDSHDVVPVERARLRIDAGSESCSGEGGAFV
jgi:hypothetical protein